jgi:transaldolase
LTTEVAPKAGMKALASLNVEIFADGADKQGILEMYRNPWIRGFTTNPTLMRKAGISDYRAFAREILAVIADRPISFEVFADDAKEMERQAREITTWGPNVYVKIPITNTSGESMLPLVRRLSHNRVKVNVTAMMTTEQVAGVADAAAGGEPCYASVFAGRVADTGRDPLPIMRASLRELEKSPNVELLWASPRELLNIFEANEIGCHVITATNDILRKLELVGKDLDEYSLETVRMFRSDAVSAGYTL